MGKVFEGIDEHLSQWIAAQALFFVASAPLDGDGHVNVSPKGPIDSLRILDERTVAYLDVVGSGAETIAHLRENGRLVIMLCAFSGPPRIVRLHGYGVPLMSYEGQRPHADAWAEKKVRVGGAEALLEYQREKNGTSLDGLPAVELPERQSL
jgi:Pyridoxamine 5'-phosphate oxidase